MAPARVYCGRLHAKTRERDLEKFFRSYGKVRDIMLKRGFAFVEFDDVRDAEDAVKDLDGKELLGDRVIVEIAHGLPRGPGGIPIRDERDRGYGRRGRDYDSRSSRTESSRSDRTSRHPPPTRTDHRIYVDNLSSRVSWQDLKDFMRQAGEVMYAEKTGSNSGVVEFGSSSAKRAAIRKLDGLDLCGRKVRLRENSRSRSRSPRDRKKSRSRSRSRSRSPRKDGATTSKDKDEKKTNGTSDKDDGKDSRKRSRSASRSKSRSASRSPSPAPKKRRKSGSDDDDEDRKNDENGKDDKGKDTVKKELDTDDEAERSRSASRSRSRSASGSRNDDEDDRRSNSSRGGDSGDDKEGNWENQDED